MPDRWSFLAPPADPAVAPLPAPPSFSVVVAAYQAQDTIDEALGSVLSQTRPPFEIVVCDDGSTDGTAERVRAYGDAVRLVSRENGGEAAAKNTAVQAARGEFVVVLDADDAWLPDRLEALGALACARPDLDVLLTDAAVEADGAFVRLAYHEGWPFEVHDQAREVLRRNFVLGMAGVRRSRWLAVGGFDEQVRLTTDWDFFLRLLLSGSRVGLVDAPLARYRLRADSLSADRVAMVESRIGTLQRAEARGGLTPGQLSGLHASLAAQRVELAARRLDGALGAGSPQVRRLAARALVVRGSSWRPRAHALLALALPRRAAARAGRRGREIGAGVVVRDA